MSSGTKHLAHVEAPGTSPAHQLSSRQATQSRSSAILSFSRHQTPPHQNCDNRSHTKERCSNRMAAHKPASRPYCTRCLAATLDTSTMPWNHKMTTTDASPETKSYSHALARTAFARKSAVSSSPLHLLPSFLYCLC